METTLSKTVAGQPTASKMDTSERHIGMVKLTLGQVCVGKKSFVCRYIPFNLSNKSFHWANKARWVDAWKEEVYYAVRKQRTKFGKLPYQRARILILFKTTRLMDYDGAYNAAKPVLDGLKKGEAGVIEDDSPKYIDLEVKQEKVAHVKDQHVEIFIKRL